MKAKIYLEDIDKTIEVEFDYFPFVRGVVNALPENCYPDEPECLDIHTDISAYEEYREYIENECIAQARD